MKHFRLVGALLVALSVAGNVFAGQRPTNMVTAGIFTMTATGPIPATNSIVNCNAAGGAITYTLPPATGNADYVTVIKTDSTANACTPAASGTDTINGSAGATITNQYLAVTLESTAQGVWALTSGQSNVAPTSTIGVYSGPTNLTGIDTVTFSAANSKLISTATANETALTFAESRTNCTTSNRCNEVWMWCQNATGNFALTVANSNVKYANGAAAFDYPLTASGSGPNCQLYYMDYNGTNFIETGESAPFVGP